ncbi:hypothetical protein DDB_G0288901 [Dictyostelium discoideum AX4]|uniref:FNIP repeat-containing protein n=1 Tax=Dictyostelium discoideum TaxID=44689 RepID=Q54IA1_DICDI|nr:hypothetical protein DDB_G0288901 [Dictyostelium discoideum AX4]EAL62974.1 hypothetical protein DDB_G0288901 [Dictyostelium discoideum AX4]|eukprot:XP_636478.1 hypothetical protein DDB_G0288901 [Dictyostelium discoideum AX4]
MNNDKLFFKIWRNQYLRFIITKFRILYEKNKKVKFLDYRDFKRYKEKEFVLEIDYQGNQLLKDGDLSEYPMVRIINLKDGIFNNVSSSIFENTLIEKIKFPPYRYNAPPLLTDINKLPNTVNSIKQFPYDLKIPIPKSIKKITISSNYYFIRDFSLVNYLKFSENENITNLKIIPTWRANSDSILIQNLFPKNLKTLDLGSYSQILNENVLPTSLEKLVFSSGYSMTFYSNKLLSLINLTHLSLSHQNVLLEPNSIPPNVTFLSIANLGNPVVDNSIIPRNLKTLIINPAFRPDYKGVSILYDTFPNSLTELKCEGFKLASIPKIFKNDDNCFFPKSIKSLSIGSNFSDGFKPGFFFPLKPPASSSSSSLCNITSITFGYYFNEIILPNILPKSLTFLKFGTNYNQPFLKDSIPPGCELKELIFGDYFNRLVDHTTIPIKSLQVLRFGSNFKVPLESIGFNKFESLKTFELDSKKYPYHIDLKSLEFPKSFETLILNRIFKFSSNIILNQDCIKNIIYKK